MKRIYFDMDGTIADFYGVKGWEQYLCEENPFPYRNAGNLVNMARLEAVCNALVECGYEFGIITWLARGSSKEFSEKTESAKLDWIDDKMPYLSDFIAIPYGTPKQKAVPRVKEMWLIDDNADVRAMWDTPKQRKSIDANGDIVAELLKILRKERERNAYVKESN